MTGEAITAFLSAHGLWIMAPAALLEGPFVTIVAGALAAQGTLNLGGVILTALLADLVGDALLWLVGRFLRDRLPRRMARRINRTIPLADLRKHSVRILLFGKLAHSLGAAVLVAAGMARVPFVPFLLVNLVATIPKVTVLALLGWTFGASIANGPDWLAPLGMAFLVMALGISIYWLRKQGKSRCAFHV